MSDTTPVPAPQSTSTIKTKINSTKKFIAKHRVALAVLATLAVTGTMSVKTTNAFSNFLESKGLTEEYYGSADNATADTATE